MTPGRRGRFVALCAVIATTATAVLGQCELDLYVVLDSSGSMNDFDGKCRVKLREELDDPLYISRKPCWELITRYSQSAYGLVSSVCASASQGKPNLSIVLFRCPNTGKTEKVLLEPTRDEAAIEQSWEDLAAQQLSGQSCGAGAMAQTQEWIEAEANQTNAEAGVSAAVADPDALVTKRPVVLVLTDGRLDDVGLQNVAATLREDFNASIIAANVFPGKKTRSTLELLTSAEFVLDAADEDSLNSLSFRVGTHITQLGETELCSEAQLACVAAKNASLVGGLEASDSCAAVGDAFTGVAACLAGGCAGLDLTPVKDSCLATAQAQGCAAEACVDVSTHTSAQAYGADNETGFGFDDAAPSPGFTSSNRRSDSALLGDVPVELALGEVYGAGAPLRGGGSSPALGSGGSVVVGSSQRRGSSGSGSGSGPSAVARFDPGSEDPAWTFESLGGDATFDASPVVSADGHVFVGDSSGLFYQLDEASGALVQLWNLGPGRIRAAAALPDGGTHVVVAVDGAPGAAAPTLHKLAIGGSEAGDAAFDQPRSWARAVCSDEEFDAAVGGVTVLEDQAVVVVCLHGFVERYSLLSGQRQWRLVTEGHIESSPAFDLEAGAIYISSVDAEAGATSLIRYNTAGESVWNIQLNLVVDASPVLDAFGNVLVFSQSGMVFRYSSVDGSPIEEASLFTFTSDAGVVRSEFTPAVDVDAAVLVLCEGQFVHLVDMELLTVTASLGVAGLVTSSPLIVDGAIYVSSQGAVLQQLLVQQAGGDSRRVLQDNGEEECDDDEWGTTAIAIAIILAVLFLVLALLALLVYKKTDNKRKR